MTALPPQALAQPRWGIGLPLWPLKGLLRPAQLLLSAPCFLYLAALTAMLLRHPDVRFYQIDRIAFGLLVAGVAARAVVLRQKLFVFERASWPMLGLVLVTLASVAGQRFDQETWSLLASKFIVPFAMFHLAGLVFTDEKRLRQFEIFSLVVLGYLAFTSIAFLLGVHALIFPRFILDPNLGAHAERARGPLLQAVANGVSLNLLGLLALHSYRRARTSGIGTALLLAAMPLAILASMTRAVWLSFAGTLLALTLVSRQSRRRMYLGASVAAAAALMLVLSSDQLGCAIAERLRENKAVEFRQAVYAGGWEMFLQRPLTGWGFHQMPDELPRHVMEYGEDKVLYPHNTYLELLAEQGILGFGLYAWLTWELWRLGRGAVPRGEEDGFLNQHFHRLWPIMLAVYWINAAVVVMSYQFVNALLFTMAGMLAAQRRRAEVCAC
ncbi:MAG TPA: O-antigen ligase family protein [Candidatus Sulfotelmatobacter sp.]|nr:O-antigen ligase family protein [Candidatus Sulfotelmatobacter sp.]